MVNASKSPETNESEQERESGGCVVIAFSNHKGGVGKTSCTVMAAQLYARAGLRVLVIDTDSQANSSEALCPSGVSPVELPSVEACLADLTKTEYCVVKSWHERIMLIASNIGSERPFPTSKSGNVSTPFIYRVDVDALRSVCERVKRHFDVILIDTAPSLSALTQAALRAADAIVLPCSPAKHAVFGLPDVIDVASSVSEAPHKILVTLTDARVRLDVIGRQQLFSRFDCVGEIPKISRLAENLYQKRYILGRVDQEKATAIQTVFDDILAFARKAKTK